MTNTPSAPTPRILLPIGSTSGMTPNVEWYAPTRARGYELRITSAPDVNSAILTGHTNPDSTATRWQPEIALPQNQALYAHVRTRFATGWSHWSPPAPFQIAPPPQPEYTIATFDLAYTLKLSPKEAFQQAHLVSALQGLVNRERPQLFVKFVPADKKLTPAITTGNVDEFWLDRLTQKNEWWGKAKLEPVADILALLKKFPAAAKGLVVWDPEVAATSNLASTIAGCEQLLPVGGYPDPDSLLARIQKEIPELKIQVDLRGKFTGTGTIPETDLPTTGSAKNDAYRWAIEKYLKSGKCDPQQSAYYIDAYWIKNPEPGMGWQNHTLTNHDYFIARRAFFWDLNIWADEATIDDPKQAPGTDLKTVLEIFTVAREQAKGRMIHLGGFTPWAFKYTDHPGAGGKHGGVPTEWETVKVLSQFRVYVDADALALSAHANASAYAHYPLMANYAQAGPPSMDELRDKGLLEEDGSVAKQHHLLFYVGDYDSAAWVASVLSGLWQDENRGQVTLPWSINPNLSLRAPHTFDWLYRTRHATDHFQCADSGAGYLNATELFGEKSGVGFPIPADKVFARHSQLWYSRFNMRTTGFVINGASGKMTTEAEKMYTAFSPDGIVNHYYPEESVRFHGDMPIFMQRSDLNNGPEKDAATIAKFFKESTPSFMMFRAILKSPTFYKELLENLDKLQPGKYRNLDPQTFAILARIQGKVPQPNRLTLVMTLPERQWTPNLTDFTIFARNDSPTPITIKEWHLELQDPDGKILEQQNFPHEEKSTLPTQTCTSRKFEKFWKNTPNTWLHIAATVSAEGTPPSKITVAYRPIQS